MAPQGPWSKYAPTTEAAPVTPGGGEYGFKPWVDENAPAAEAPMAASGGTSDASPVANSPATPPQSFAGQVGRQVGLAGRQLLEGTIGLPYDLAASGFRAVGVPVNNLSQNLTSLGLPVEQTGLEKAVGAASRGVASALTPAAIVQGAQTLGTMSAPTAELALNAFGHATVPNALLGASAGVASDAAQQAAPDAYKPLAGLAGGLAGVGVPLLAGHALAGAGRAAGNAVSPLLQRARPVVDEQGAPVLSAIDNTPLTAKPYQQQAAAGRLASNTSDVEASRNALADYGGPAIPGDQPTTFQVTRDPQLGMQEKRVAATGGTEVNAAFRGVRDAQNDARVAELQRLAPEGNVQAVPDAARTYAARQDATLAAKEDATRQASETAAAQNQSVAQQVQGLADQALDRAGGNLPAGSEAAVGVELRQPVLDAQGNVKKQASALYEARDPDNKAALTVAPLKDDAAAIVASRSKVGQALHPEEASIFEDVQNLGDVERLSDVQALAGRIKGVIRDLRPEAKYDQSVRRLSLLLDGLNENVATAAREGGERVAASADSAAASSADASIADRRDAPVDQPTPAPQVGNRVYTPSGQPIDVQYGLHEADNLITSHDNDLKPNPAYPQELQPRQRDRMASKLQVNDIAANLQPERLGASTTVADGAPIIGPDGIVESGNGRLLALRKAYADNGPQAQGYRDYLTQQGYDASGFEKPVLARTRQTPIADADRAAFTQQGNASSTLAISATEQAATDAGRLSADVLDTYRGGSVNDAQNADFLRAFAKNVVEPNQRNAFASGAGKLSQDGLKRVQTALVHKAYDDQGLSAALSESTDSTAKVLAGAMQDAAGPMAQLKSDIQAGRVDPGVDLGPSLTEATQLIASARVRGISLQDALAQGDAFSKLSPEAEMILKAAYGPELSGRMSRSRMASFLEDYAREARQQSTNADLLRPNESADQILQGVTQRYGKAASGGGQAQAGAAPRNASGLGAGDAQRGGAGRGLGDGAAGQGDAGGTGAAASAQSSAVLDQPKLTPNFDEATRQRTLAADKFYANDYKRVFKDAPGVGTILKKGQTAGSFATPDALVPNVIVKSGPQGADFAKAYMAAGGDGERLANAAAYKLRQTPGMIRQDGTLDPGKAARFIQDHASFLSQTPDVAKRFKTAALAQREVDRLTAQQAKAFDDSVNQAIKERAQASKALQAGPIGKFLGEGDVPTLVGRIVNDKALGLANAKALKAAIGNDPEVMAGLERAVGALIHRDYTGNALGATSGSYGLKSDQLQTLIRTKEPVLRELLSDEGFGRFRKVADSLERSRLSMDGNTVGGGSDSAQKVGGVTRTLLGKIGGTLFEKGAGVGIGTGAGTLVAGLPGAAIGGNVGGMIHSIISAARAAGIENVNRLEAEALLNPNLARILYAKVNPQNEKALGNALASQLRRISLVAAQPHSDGKDRQQSVSRTVLMR